MGKKEGIETELRYAKDLISSDDVHLVRDIDDDQAKIYRFFDLIFDYNYYLLLLALWLNQDDKLMIE